MQAIDDCGRDHNQSAGEGRKTFEWGWGKQVEEVPGVSPTGSSTRFRRRQPGRNRARDSNSETHVFACISNSKTASTARTIDATAIARQLVMTDLRTMGRHREFYGGQKQGAQDACGCNILTNNSASLRPAQDSSQTRRRGRSSAPHAKRRGRNGKPGGETAGTPYTTGLPSRGRLPAATSRMQSQR